MVTVTCPMVRLVFWFFLFFCCFLNFLHYISCCLYVCYFLNQKIKGIKEKVISLWQSQRYRYTHKLLFILGAWEGGDWKRKLLTFSWSISALFDLFKQIRILIKENEIEMFNKKILHGKVEKRLHGKLPWISESHFS